MDGWNISSWVVRAQLDGKAETARRRRRLSVCYFVASLDPKNIVPRICLEGCLMSIACIMSVDQAK